MGRGFITWAGPRTGAIILFAVLCLIFPGHSFAWRRNGQRLVVNKAIDTLEALPPEFRGFFDSHDDFDGRLSAQPGVNERFGAALIDRYSSFFPMRPNDAVFVSDPTDRAFEACLSSHSWLETILLADRNARRGESSFNDEYYDRFYNQAAAILIRQLSDAATDVGSFWFTAWKNAGSPQLPH